MPNHVENYISLQGDPKKIRSMLKAIHWLWESVKQKINTHSICLERCCCSGKKRIGM